MSACIIDLGLGPFGRGILRPVATVRVYRIVGDIDIDPA